MKKNKLTITFYVLALIYLVIAAITIFNTYQSLSESAIANGISLADNWVIVLQQIMNASAGFFGFAFVLYGFALVFDKNNVSPSLDEDIKVNKKNNK